MRAEGFRPKRLLKKIPRIDNGALGFKKNRLHEHSLSAETVSTRREINRDIWQAPSFIIKIIIGDFQFDLWMHLESKIQGLS